MKSTSSSSKINRQDLVLQALMQEKPYVEITNQIEVCVWPEFIDKKTSFLGDLYIWTYLVRISNKSADEIKLISRYWRILDECGNVQEIEGEGVVGVQPKILPNSSYQYSSGVHLKYPSGIMSGKYRIKNLTKSTDFEIKIPNFSLDIPSVKKILN